MFHSMFAWFLDPFFNLGFIKNGLGLTQGPWTHVVGPMCLWLLLAILFSKVKKGVLWSFLLASTMTLMNYGLPRFNKQEGNGEMTKAVDKASAWFTWEMLIPVGIFVYCWIMFSKYLKLNKFVGFLAAAFCGFLAYLRQDFLLDNIWYVVGSMILLLVVASLGTFNVRSRGRTARATAGTSVNRSIFWLVVLVLLTTFVIWNWNIDTSKAVGHWYIFLLLAVVAVVFVLYRRFRSSIRWSANSNAILALVVGSATIVLIGTLFGGWLKEVIFYEGLFSTLVVSAASMLWVRVKNNPHHLAPQESEESMVPHAFDPSKENPLISKEGESIQAYNARRQRSIEALSQENDPYRNFVSKQALVALFLMTLTTVGFIFVNPVMVFAFAIWVIFVATKIILWLKKGDEEGVDVDNNIRKHLSIANAWPLGTVFVLGSLSSQLIGIGHLGWDLLWFSLYSMLMIAYYFLSCVYIVPIRRRWVFTVFNRVVKARKFVFYTPDKDGILDKAVEGVHNEKTKNLLRVLLDELDVDGDHWLDVGINVGVVSWLFVGVIDVIGNYFMVIEHVMQTRFLPTRGIDDRDDLDIKTKAAGTLSYFFRYFLFVGVDPLSSSRLSIGEREDIVPQAAREMENHLANKAKTLDFDTAMLFPLGDNELVEEQDDEITKLLCQLNRQLMVLSGSFVLKMSIVDRDPAKNIQDAMDRLTALVYERDQAAIQAESTRIEMEAVGAGRAAELEKIAAMLKKDPDNVKVYELLIKHTGADKASIHEFIQSFSRR